MISFLAAKGLNPGALIVPSEETDPTKSTFAKSIAMFAAGKPIICVLPSTKMVDYALLAKALGVGRKKVGLASVVDCVRVFGYVPGTMPPLGHRSIVETLIDPACVADDSVPVCLGSGSQDFNLLLKPAELLSLSGGRAVKLQKREASAASASSRQVSSPANPGELRFLLTPELSRLVRWLRAVGVDARLSEESSPDFDVILDKAEEEDRIILTKNGKLFGRRGAEACYFLASNDTKEQFQEVAKHFGVEWNDDKFLTICSKCNSHGFHGPLTEQETVAQCGENCLPERVLGNVTEFWLCKNDACKQIYWVGPKYKDADVKFRSLFEDKAEGF